ncbi:MAG: hypothetical protein Q4F01_03495 [Staphylococcus rostri]|uniref:hypothetical protein n=1 Tax=Staphylococcus rostri TaxID=522262 RepID=UPI0026DEBB2A|nr:hypothetical protein [Staphylococcus rostri]MDO5375228.1 hypothetical protein [Staphylococcus rostri]
MSDGKEILSPMITHAVDDLNKMSSFENKFVYHYDAQNDWYDIMHSIENDIQQNDEIAKMVSDILYHQLISQGVYNFSFYEDKHVIAESTYEFEPNVNKHIEDKVVTMRN